MKIFLLVIFTTFFIHPFFGQSGTSYKATKFKVEKKRIFNPRIQKDDFNANLNNLEAPSPSGNSVKSHILQQKIKSRELFPIKVNKGNKGGEKSSTVAEPTTGKEFGLLRHLPNGTSITLSTGIPSDNTLAISDDGIVLMGVNSFIYAYDVEKDTSIFPSQWISLSGVAGNGGRDFDPKIIYDKESDRFILVFLRGADPATSLIFVCFSTTSNPLDDWFVYTLPGNPLNNNRWTDFPAIAITDTDLFITGNLIVPDTPWQVGFDGSIIWQIEKENGYNNDSTLNTVFYNDIKYDDKFVRNLHPVQGADGAADKMYLLSNRNFDIINDSIFLLHIDGSSTDDTTMLTVDAYQSNINYGVPPNGKQFDTDLSDATSGLQTNDARVLGAINLGDDIQFVSTCVNPTTGLAGIYHGTFSSINDAPAVTAKIIGDSIQDYGYPNIAWTGDEKCDIETIIGFNYTSKTDFPGMAAVYYNNDGEYSDVKVIKQGENYVDVLNGTNERWGDYFGLQRWYKNPRNVFSFGYYGTQARRITGWGVELISPDTSQQMNLSIEHNNQASLCLQTITANVNGGVAPYEYQWSNDLTNGSNSMGNVCLNDTIDLTVIDARGCEISQRLVGETIDLGNDGIVYPNPFSTQLAVQFTLEEEEDITAKIYDMRGRLVTELIQRRAKKGLNELVFSTYPLSTGEYVLRIEAGDKEILNEKILKQ